MISPVSCLSSRRSQGTFPTTPPFQDIAKRRRRPIGDGETWENTGPAPGVGGSGAGNKEMYQMGS